MKKSTSSKQAAERKTEILRMVKEIDSDFFPNVIDYLYVLVEDAYTSSLPMIEKLNQLKKEGK